MELLSPKDHAERVAMFRHGIIGSLIVRELAHGELRAELEQLSKQCFRPPGAANTRTYSIPTFERWLYDCKRGGVEALRPSPRADKGHGRCFDADMRELLCDIRREHRSASVPLILDTLVKEGRLPAEAKDHEAVVRKLFAERGLRRCSARVERVEGSDAKRTRLRWQAEHRVLSAGVR